MEIKINTQAREYHKMALAALEEKRNKMEGYVTISAAVAIADYAADEHPYSKERDKPETWTQYNQGWNDACDYIRNKLEEKTVADVAPVRHGRWVVKREYNDILKIDVEKYTCSACGDYWLTAVGLSLANNYCPNCGARMDG